MLHKDSSSNHSNEPEIPYSPVPTKENPLFIPPLVPLAVLEPSIDEGSIISETNQK